MAGERVIVGMSGGVDSAVCALLLKEQGYDVIGVMLKLWTEEEFGAHRLYSPSDAINSARQIAEKLDIPFHLVDVSDLFHELIVMDFIQEYVTGRTPNPCAKCNSLIRWNELLRFADCAGAPFIATGHYAQIARDAENSVRLLRGKDTKKDQSYVLCMTPKRCLERTFFPLENLEKNKIRQIAEERMLPCANKPDSQDICFIADGNYQGFLKRHYSGKIEKGDIVDINGKKLGAHSGLPFYTIGQRKGLRVCATEAHYVIAKNIARNEIIVGKANEAYVRSFLVRDCNWIRPMEKDVFETQAQIRYKSIPKQATARKTEENELLVEILFPARDIAPGQVCAFYSTDGNEVHGGGIIAEVYL